MMQGIYNAVLDAVEDHLPTSAEIIIFSSPLAQLCLILCRKPFENLRQERSHPNLEYNGNEEKWAD